MVIVVGSHRRMKRNKASQFIGCVMRIIGRPWIHQQRLRQVRDCSHFTRLEMGWWWIDRILNIFLYRLVIKYARR